ncbi:MAG: diaminobutyrate acetyltransferase [Pseudohongiellaceae bacterium]|nr:diaminobutyrate acetyltransferase [Pseudohongiellaceae bacterium]
MNDTDSGSRQLVLRSPIAEDGASVWRLVGQCPPLDTNSMYCNLLQATHFSQTSVAATQLEAGLLGFVSGYRLPSRPQTLFVWQVAVSEAARGQGLAKRMIMHILQRPENSDIDRIETTITESNGASWALFTSLANDLSANLNKKVMFDEQQHFDGEHATEMLVTVGPISSIAP